jgi:hypothetical protein
MGTDPGVQNDTQIEYVKGKTTQIKLFISESSVNWELTRINFRQRAK